MASRFRPPSGDPRRDAPARDPGPTDAGDIRPLVAAPGSGASTALIASGIVAAALALFLLLDGHRQAIRTPAVRATSADRAAAAGVPAPPPLYLPPAPVVTLVPAEPAPAVPVVRAPPEPPRIVYVAQPAAPAVQAPPAFVPQPPRRSEEAALVIDTTVADGNPGATATAGPSVASDGPTPAQSPFATLNAATTAAPGARARATMLGGRATTVLQGTLIPAVLETALDSTRPGLARALVSRDVRGFDGSRVLIPRGSRLTGEYRSDVAQGQNRALIVWTRLVRPDGAAIALTSPAADTLGRAGVKAEVDNHFFTRFTGAILQSVLAVGVNLASRPSNDTLVLGLPGATLGGFGGVSGGGGFNQNPQVTPTLKVRPGASIGVFVARDLEFPAVAGRR